MQEVKFVIPGKPVAKQRPRATARSGFVSIYSPAQTVNYEKLVAESAREAMEGHSLMIGPVSVDLDIIITIPASWPRKKQQEAISGQITPITGQDLDNICKSVCDGMNKIVYHDDKQIIQSSQRKRYGTNTCVLVTVQEQPDARFLTWQEFIAKET